MNFPCIVMVDSYLTKRLSLQDDGLLHTTCGTPNYVAPEVQTNKRCIISCFFVVWIHKFVYFDSLSNYICSCYIYRFLLIEAMMERMRTCGHAEWSSLYWLPVTYLLMILILWNCIKKWVRMTFRHYFSDFTLSFVFVLWLSFLDPQISSANFTCPPWLSFSARKLITRILEPNPTKVRNNIWLSCKIELPKCTKWLNFGPRIWLPLTIWQRITIAEILEDEWFKKDYKPPVFEEIGETNLDDVEAVFKDSAVR